MAEKTADLTLTGGPMRFEVALGSGHSIVFDDGEGDTGVRPAELVVAALAGCTAVDVVDILKKRRTEPTALDMVITAQRADGTPRRLVKVHLAYRITGGGVERDHALRAIELAVTKYCSVRDSLDPELPVTWSLELLPG